jgi:hypothetical protein
MISPNNFDFATEEPKDDYLSQRPQSTQRKKYRIQVSGFRDLTLGPDF